MASLSGSATVNGITPGPESGATIEAGPVIPGARSTFATCSVTVREPGTAFAAVNVAVYVPESANVGVHASVPDAAPGAAVNIGAPPGGAGERLATRLATGSPAGSAAVTESENGAPSPSTKEAPGALTTGGPKTPRLKSRRGP